MASRTHLAKTFSPKTHKGKGKKMGQTASQADFRESLPLNEEVTGDSQKSRERIISLLDEKINTDTVATDLYAQLQARDKLIEQLNARIASSGKKPDNESLATKDKQVKLLLEEKAQLAKSLKTSEERVVELEGKVAAAEKTLEEEKEQLEVLNEALTEENEAVKSQLQSKMEQLRGAKNDIVDMSKIVEDLTKLNGELNEKIQALNEEMERNNTEHYQATKKAEQVEELERELVQSKTAQQQLEVKLKTALEESAAAKELREILYHISKETDGVIAKISVVEHEAAREAVEILDKLVSEMRVRAKAPRENNPDRIAVLKAKIRETQEALENERRKVAEAQASEKAHLSRVESLAAEHERMKASLQDHIERLKRRLEPLQGLQEKASGQRHELEKKVENLNAELQRKQTEAAYLTDRQQAMKTRIDELRKSEDESRKMARELHLENIQLQSEHALLQETANALEQKGKEMRSKQSTLSDELWKRDNELLRKEMLRMKLSEELNEVKVSLQHAQARLKSRAAEDNGQLNTRLEEKDKEIAALKRMLQGKPDSELSRKPEAARRTDPQMSERDLAEKLEDSLRKVMALVDIGEDTSNAKAAAIIKGLQSALSSFPDVILSAETIMSFENLHRVCGDNPTSISDVLKKAGSLLPS